MTKTSNKIVFFGSGPVAAKSLALLLANFEVEAVVTKPTTKFEMQKVAKDVQVYTVSNKSELDTLVRSQKFESRLGVLIDFGIIVSSSVISSFPLGIVNSHFSILPEWRGADPINFAILSGQQETGVSLMLLVEAMDEGPLLIYSTYKLPPDITSIELTQNLIHISNDMLRHTIPEYQAGRIALTDQSRTGRSVSYSRKLTKKDGVLDFNKPAEQLEREIRAFIEWPKSRTELAGKDVVILSASVDETQSGEIGKAYKTNDKKIAVYTAKGSLIIDMLKPAGKKAMTAEAFLAGHSL